jgi:murein DD-endopeptidase MepM/ murein hydrolase activator NlpD
MARRRRLSWQKRTSEALVTTYRLFVPARHPGRPGSHPLSKFFRQTLEHRRARRIISVGLTLLVMTFGQLSNLLAAKTQAVEVALISQPENQLITLTTLEKPLPDGRLAQGFHGFHRGIDLLSPLGTPINPIADGVVTEVSFGRLGWGNTVVVTHENGLASRYAHMSQIKVKVNQNVSKSDTVGNIGLTGWTTGPHLHLEIYQNGRAIDPASVLPAFASPDYAIAKGK